MSATHTLVAEMLALGVACFPSYNQRQHLATEPENARGAEKSFPVFHLIYLFVWKGDPLKASIPERSLPVID